MAEIEAGVASLVEDYENRGVNDPSFADTAQSHRVAYDELSELWHGESSPEAEGLIRNWFYMPVGCATLILGHLHPCLQPRAPS